MNEIDLGLGNMLDRLPADRSEEHVAAIVRLSDGRIERIVSFGHCSPDGFWYDQDDSEWVLVLRGHARLEIDGFPGTVELNPGDYINLSAHTRHRVAWTTPDEPTIWLAIHY
jgi:cupin 2 domain-containing protein